MSRLTDIKQHDYEKAVRFAGFRVAAYIGELARNLTPDETKVYETCTIKEGFEKYPDLPRVAYVQMLQSQGLLHDTYVYGVDAKKIVPTILNPTEIMDGAIVSGNCVSACDKNPTYVHLNNPVVHDLFEEHGKTINFVCQIITNENVYLADKQRSSDWTAKLCKLLDLDGVIVSQEGFGNPDTDLIMNCKKIEAEGVKTVIITDEYAGRDGKSQSLSRRRCSSRCSSNRRKCKPGNYPAETRQSNRNTGLCNKDRRCKSKRQLTCRRISLKLSFRY